MGWKISWVTVHGKPRRAIHDELGLAPRGSLEYDWFDYPIAGGRLGNGWYLITLNDVCHPFVEDGSLARISVGCEVLACQVLETTMDSVAQFWTSGRRTWHIYHTAQVDLFHLDVSGQPPDRLNNIRSKRMKKQIEAGGHNAEVDYIFEIPLQLARSITGFSHDRDLIPSRRRKFEVLDWASAQNSQTQNSPSVSKAWWRLW